MVLVGRFGIGNCIRAWFTFLLIVVCLYLHAQDIDSAPVQLTLQSAVKIALRQNIEVLIATIEVATRGQDRVLARSELIPHAGVTADNAVSRYNLKAQIGVQIPGFPNSIGPYNSIHVGSSFSGPIFDLTLLERYKATSHLLAASRENQQAIREQTVLLTVSEYMAHLRALASISAAESQVKLALRLDQQAKDLRTDGVATGIDVSRAEVRLREEQQKLMDAKRDADVSLYALRRILNFPDAQQILFSDQQELFTTPSLNLDNPLADALAQRPEMHELADQIIATKAEHRAAVAESLPSLSLIGSWNEQGETFNTLTPGYEYRFEFKLPLFSGGRLTAERRQTALSEEKVQKQLIDERDRVTEEVRDSQMELEAAKNDVELGQQEVQLANEQVALSEGRFRSGVTDNIEVVAAQDALARANDTEIGALYRYNIARAQLAHAVGKEEETYSH